MMGGAGWIATVCRLCNLWGVGSMYVVYAYIVGDKVLRIPYIFLTAGFILIRDLVVCEKLRICIIKIINAVFVLIVCTYVFIICCLFYCPLLKCYSVGFLDWSCCYGYAFSTQLFCCSVQECYTGVIFWIHAAFPCVLKDGFWIIYCTVLRDMIIAYGIGIIVTCWGNLLL
jgi:hypothetical protein